MEKDFEVVQKLFNKYLSKKKSGEITIDIFDILESLEEIAASKDKIVNIAINDPDNADELLTHLVEIDVHLSHIHWHYKSYRKKVNKIAKAIGDDE